MDNPTYEVTNENIYGIKKSLNPRQGDKIYSILGSGDIPFMFVENGAEVLAVDRNDEQIKYVRKRIGNFLSGNLDGFRKLGEHSLSHKNALLRDRYFSKIDLENFNAGINNLQFLYGNFFNPQFFEGHRLNEFCLEVEEDYSYYNKVYLSNALDYYVDSLLHLPRYELDKRIEDFFDKFKSGTQFHLASFYCKSFERYANLRELEVDFEGFEVDSRWKTFLVEKR